MVVSTVTGEPVAVGAELAGLLVRQVTEPVRFAQAIISATEDADLVVEVGPGQVLSGLVRDTVPVPVVATDSDSVSLAGILRVAAAGHVLGAPVRYSVLFDGRHVKPLPDTFRFFANPCETVAPLVEVSTLDTEVAAGGSLELVRRLAAERAELPIESVGPDSGLLDELHLSSITVGQVVADAVRAKGLPPAAAPLNLATATVRQIADVLDQLGAAGPAAPTVIDGVAPWVRPFSVEHVPLPRPPANHTADGAWRLFAPDGHPVAGQLRDALQQAGVGDGVVAVDPDPALALAAAKVARGRFVLVHHGEHAGTAGLAKSFFLENPAVSTLVVEAPPTAEAVPWVVAEVAATTGFAEVRYDAAGVRTQPVLRVLPTAPQEPPLSDGDVLLVTGGGKGITAECALAIAADTGATVALLGRSSADDPELAANLNRFRAAGVSFRYLRVDVTDAAAVRDAVASVGPVTAVLHGAGRNVPRRLAELDDGELRDTLAPKVDGLRAVLDAVDPGRLRLLVTFGSIIGRAGLAGEAHYATANAALTELTERYGREHPHCRSLALEWSVWSGAGMGERLGVVDSLRHNGITPITTADGLALLRDVLATPDTPATLVVTGRVSGLPTVTVERRDVPPLRFTDRVLVDYPGVELVTEAALSTSDDRYLEDHVLEGNLMFPAVLGMEAMTQVARAVTGRDELPALERVEFSRPIVVPRQGRTTIRVVALVRGPDTVDVAIRSDESGFTADHFRATCRFPRPAPTGEPAPPALPRLPLDPGTDLYGVNLFQGRRFQRLAGYRQLGAARCVAELAPASEVDWFDRFLPGGLLLGDPGVRDAFMQAIQGSRPDQTLLPVGVERVLPGSLGSAPLVVSGLERHREQDEVVWDLTARDESGTVVERWEGLRLRVVRTSTDPLPAPLLGPYLERHLDELFGGAAPEVTVAPDASTMTVTGEFSCAVDTDRLRCAAALTTEPLTTMAGGPPGWVVYAAGEARIATYATTPRGSATEVVLAVRGK
jgi:enediyne polyketide synthase